MLLPLKRSGQRPLEHLHRCPLQFLLHLHFLLHVLGPALERSGQRPLAHLAQQMLRLPGCKRTSAFNACRTNHLIGPTHSILTGPTHSKLTPWHRPPSLWSLRNTSALVWEDERPTLGRKRRSWGQRALGRHGREQVLERCWQSRGISTNNAPPEGQGLCDTRSLTPTSDEDSKGVDACI